MRKTLALLLFACLLIPNAENNFTFQLRESSLKSSTLKLRKLIRINPIRINLRSAISAALTRSNVMLFSAFGIISATPTTVDAPKILRFAEKCLSHEGPLNRTEEGFVYVKVSDDYIFETLKLLGDNTIKAPPYFGKGKVGAHISVIYADEMKDRVPILPHLGKSIDFKIVNFAEVDMRNENKCIYLFIVESPELERIRAINDLPSNMHGNELHITVGVKKLAQ